MHDAHCFQGLYCSTHYCINHLSDDIFSKPSRAVDFRNNKGQQPLQRLDNAQPVGCGEARTASIALLSTLEYSLRFAGPILRI